MKFAKELDRDLVPEWRVKYLDYKAGKKKVKAVARAIARANVTPRTPAQPEIGPRRSSTYGTIFSPTTSKPQGHLASWSMNGSSNEHAEPLSRCPAPLGKDSRPETKESAIDPLARRKSPPIDISTVQKTLEAEDTSDAPSPVPISATDSKIPFELPGPAVSPQTPLANSFDLNPDAIPERQRRDSMEVANTAYEVGPTSAPRAHHASTFSPIRSCLPSGQDGPLLRRIFPYSGTPPSEFRRSDVSMMVADQVRLRQKEFFSWMDNELEKVESFYKLKEDEAGARLMVLRDQLHEMRDRRTQEVAEAVKRKSGRKDDGAPTESNGRLSDNQSRKVVSSSQPTSHNYPTFWLGPVERVLEEAKAAVIKPRVGSNSKALQSLQISPELRTKSQPGTNNTPDDHRDYIRRPHNENEVPYRVAKRKLKLALQEFYRGMELLKSYALLNRTAFRKINKKYDKAIDAHPPLRYMSEKVNNARFVQSDVLDGHLNAVEDLYARYFERGNHKVATGKLRSSQGKHADQSSSAFRSGLLIGIGAVFAIQGVINAAALLHHPNQTIQAQTSYLLQIYGGYFLTLYLFSWFCLDCSIWARNKINYTFVFEFDPRHNLDWRQLAEFPALFIFLLGLFIWINFSRYGASGMFIYYPVILIFVTVVIVFFPAPILFHKSRKWLVYSHWRLLLAGLYPVEFRDFFLGDMYCSLTYTMANIGLFFCLYAHHWNDPPQCNSSHSRLLGFLSALPGVWRALQCLRRYRDTRNVFPHLVNFGKYAMTIMYYATLSVYRIKRTNDMLALFTIFATINAIYCSIWDLLMDWSLLQPHANKRLLRDVRGYKNKYWYYLAMFLDPILRFNWIFYSIYTHDLQHSTIVSFLVGLSEVTRRGMWTLFRVENEHCSNVARFKAFRDVPLPYAIESSSQESLSAAQGVVSLTGAETTSPLSPYLSRQHTHTSTGLELRPSRSETSVRRRSQLGRTFTKILADAHTQDFVKKRKPTVGDGDDSRGLEGGHTVQEDSREGSSDEDEDDVDDVERDLSGERDIERG